MEVVDKYILIIVVIVYVLVSEKYNLFNFGMDDYVIKLINEFQLIYIVQKWIGVNLYNVIMEGNLYSISVGLVDVVDMMFGLKFVNNKV